MWIVCTARWPICNGPKSWRVMSSVTPGSWMVPASKKGTSMPSSGTWKRQCDSATSTASGVKWKTISNLRPARIWPLRVWQRKGCAPAASETRSSSIDFQKKSFVLLVGFTTEKRFVFRTRVPSELNSITLVAGSRGPSEPSGPGMSGERRPART